MQIASYIAISRAKNEFSDLSTDKVGRGNVGSSSTIQGRKRQRVSIDQKYFNSLLSQGKMQNSSVSPYFDHGGTALVSIKMLASIG